LIQRLAFDPQRQALAPENAKVDEELREFHFGKKPYILRIVFTIEQDCVRVLRVRRAQRRPLTRKEIRNVHREE
jgi:uncharacterized DUF497 family protein